MKPTEGRVEVGGRIGSLLELGAGFHPEFTGRENVYLNGAILGLKRAAIDRHLEEIVAFSELERFIDVPVRTYSSGMKRFVDHVRAKPNVRSHTLPIGSGLEFSVRTA